MKIAILIFLLTSLIGIIFILYYFLLMKKKLIFINKHDDLKYNDFNINEFVLELAEVVYCNNPIIIFSYFNILRNCVAEIEISTLIINEIKNRNNFIRMIIRIALPKVIKIDILYPIDGVINNNILEFQKLMIKPAYAFDIENDIIVRKAPSNDSLYEMLNNYTDIRNKNNDLEKLEEYLLSNFHKVNFHDRIIYYLYEH